MSDTDLCAYCGGDCPMAECRTCHGCESIACRDCDDPYQPDPSDPAEVDDYLWDPYDFEEEQYQ